MDPDGLWVLGERGRAEANFIGCLRHILQARDRREPRPLWWPGMVATALLGPLFAVTVLLTACSAPTEFTVPLADVGDFEIDGRLAGTWYGVSTCADRDEGDWLDPCRQSGCRPAQLTLLHITPSANRKELHVRATATALDVEDLKGNSGEGGGENLLPARSRYLEATVHPAKVDGVTYYNVRRREGVGYDYSAKGEKPHFMIAQAELPDPSTLNLRLAFWPYELRQFGEERRLGLFGSVGGDPAASYHVVESTRERLITALRAERGAELLFVTFGPFRRLSAGPALGGLETKVCMPESDGRYPRFNALAETAGLLTRVGLHRMALESTRLALEVVEADPPRRAIDLAFRWGSALGHVAEAQAAAGDLDAAKATIAMARGKPGYKPYAFSRALALTGRTREAVELAQRDDGMIHADTLADIAVIQARSGDPVGALDTARVAGSTLVAIKLAEAFASNGDDVDARTTLKAALIPGNRRLAPVDVDLHSIARWDGERGFVGTYEDLHQIVGTTRGPGAGYSAAAHAVLRLLVAEQQAERGYTDDARTSLEPTLAFIDEAKRQSQDDPLRAIPLHRVMALQMRLGDGVAARQLLETQVAVWKAERDVTRSDTTTEPPSPSSYWATRAIALAYAATGNTTEAVAIAKKRSKDEREFGDLRYSIAEIRLRAGDKDGARSTLAALFRERRAERQGAEQHSVEWTARDSPALYSMLGLADAAAYFMSVTVERDALRQHHRMLGDYFSSMQFGADEQARFGDLGGARTSAIHAFILAKSIPKLQPCRGTWLLSLLWGPDPGEPDR